MLFQMLAGVLPFRGDSMAELMYKIANEEAPDIRIIRPELPETLANLVALSMAKRPETRYQDGDTFAAELRSVLAGIPGGADFASSGFGASRPAPISPAVSQTTTVQAGEKTVVMGATGAAVAVPQFEKTMVQSAQTGSGPTVAVTPAPAEFDKTAVFARPGASKPGDHDIEI